jgi:Apea-like HEPN
MDHRLKQDSEVYKVLLSSPIKLEGSYQQEDVLIEPVHPNRMGIYSFQTNRFDRSSSENLIGRYYYMLVFDFMPPQNEQSVIIPDYSHIGDYICIALSVLYGKRFDNHGMIEGSGFFWMPHYEDLISFSPRRYYPPYSDFPRNDISIKLELKEAAPVVDFTVHCKNEKLFRYFFNAAKFYLGSIKSIHSDLDKAYLDLITCGEILSNFYDYSEDELFDDDLHQLLKRLISCNVPDKDLRLIKNRLYQVKRKFFLTLKNLINESFFEATESKVENGKFTQENIDKSIKSAYDLRSHYVHTGFEFKDWIQVCAGSEYHLSEVLPSGFIPNVDTKDLRKLIEKIPTYVGLERIMRFALLRFLHTNGIYIHCDLDS